jgi:hypothetical protein
MKLTHRASARRQQRWLTFPLLVLAGSAWIAGCGGSEESGDDDDSNEAGSPGSGATGATGGTRGGTAGRDGSGGTGGSSRAGGAGAGGSTTGSGGSASAEGGAAGEGGSATDGLRYPLTLTPIGTPSVDTAHVSLYFTVTDADGEPVPGLRTGTDGDLGDFQAQENGTRLDPFESAFRVTHPTSALVIPTVLLLDLSRSVVEAGALDDLKEAAGTIIDSLDASQRLAIVTFASEPTLRQDFTADKDLLHDAVDAIDDADGIATNLYGSLSFGYGLWQDGFQPFDASSSQLVAGLMIAVSDGNDTAGVQTLSEVVTARANKRTLFIRVGDALDRDVADQIANAGVIDAAGGFEELDSAVEATTDRIASLNDAIYAAEYCSPKRAGSHALLFTVTGNEDYLSGGGGGGQCEPTGTGPSCGGTADMYCGSDPSGENDYVCCAPTHPYLCFELGNCYATEDEAYEACAGSCRSCSEDEEGGSVGQAGYAIEVGFTASNFNDDQCAALFEDPDDGAGGAGGQGGGGSGGSGGSAGGGALAACKKLLEEDIPPARNYLCSSLDGDPPLGCGLEQAIPIGCSALESPCESELTSYFGCISDELEAGPDSYSNHWTCGEYDAPLCEDTTCTDEIEALESCIGG